jgi:hypothetical protein
MPQLDTYKYFNKKYLKNFYLFVSLLILSSLTYHLIFLHFFDLDFYHHVQNILFNILFLIFLYFCHKILMSKTQMTFMIVNVFILLFCLLQLQVSFCEFANLYLYLQSDNIFFLKVDELSVLEEYVIPFYKWLLEGLISECAGNKGPKGPKIPPTESDLLIKRFSPIAQALVGGVQGGALGLTPALVYKGLGGATPPFIKGLPPLIKAAAVGSMATGGYIIAEIAKAGS